MDFWKVLDEGYGISRGFLAVILHASSSSLLSADKSSRQACRGRTSGAQGRK